MSSDKEVAGVPEITGASLTLFTVNVNGGKLALNIPSDTVIIILLVEPT